jgi:serine/threonine-protein kinase HipA
VREIETQVYIDLEGTPHHVGRLFTHIRNGRERATLEYTDAWREHQEAFPLAPALSVDHGRHHTRSDREIFAPLTDSAPDRWGRRLIARRERRVAREEGRDPRTLYEIDYLLQVSDLTRQGALRFAREEGGPFVANGEDEPVPPMVELPRLLRASERFLADTDTREDLRLLLAPGSSLGGARPKASVRGTDGTLLMAKFPAPGDDWNVVRWEAVALTLAENAGLTTPTWNLRTIEGKCALVLERFDRSGEVRRPYLSALSMLDAVDHDTRSYAEIADALRRHGSSPDEDLPALWRRIVFNVLISNTDDHLRNHGFLYEGIPGWTLAPVFDVNPVPRDVRPRVLSTPVWVDEDPTASLEIALEHAEHFRLDPDEAREVIAEVETAVADWRDVADRHGLTRREIERMASAFEHEDRERVTAS